MYEFLRQMLAYYGFAMYLVMGFETLELKFRELKLSELTVSRRCAGGSRREGIQADIRILFRRGGHRVFLGAPC